MKKQKKRRPPVGRLPGETLAESIQRKKRTQAAYIQYAQDRTLEAKSEVRTQRALWMACIAMNRAFGIGKKRFALFAAELQTVVDWYEEMLNNTDEVYANEKLRREASRCSGIEVRPLFEEDLLADTLARYGEEVTAAEA